MVRSQISTVLGLLMVVAALVVGSHSDAQAARRENPGVRLDPLFERHAEARAAWRAIDPRTAARIHGELQRRVVRGSTWPETLFNALSVMAAQIDELERDGVLAEDRVSIGAFLTVSLLQQMIDMHPELREKVANAFTEGLSPIESMCECDKRGSRACGCLVISTGAGSCEYKVACPTFGKALCSAVNVELCIADTVTDIFF